MKKFNLITILALLAATSAFAGEASILKSLTSLTEMKATEESARYELMAREINKIRYDLARAGKTGIQVPTGEKESIQMALQDFVGVDYNGAERLLFRLESTDNVSEDLIKGIFAAAKKSHDFVIGPMYRNGPPPLFLTFEQGPQGLIARVKGNGVSYFAKHLIYATRQALNERNALRGAEAL